MPLYKATVYFLDDLQAIDGLFTFNAHVTTGGTSDDAWELANEIAEALVGTVMPDNIHAYKVAISNPDVINGNQSRPVSLDGTRATTGSALPSWNTVKFQGRSSFSVRPSIWHVRCGLTEDDVTGQNLVAGVLTAFGALETAFNALTGLCDINGFAYTDFSADELIRSRQQGWHRRTRPGYKRGWVPV